MLRQRIDPIYESCAQRKGTSKAVDVTSDLSALDEANQEFDLHMFGTTRANTTELDIFLSEPNISIYNDPLAWWSLAETRFPTLACIARDYIGVPGMVHG